MSEAIRIYGISNCDTIKKARAWLTQHEVTFDFHDFRKQGLDPDLLQQWVDELGWELLLNKRGTTWRQLPDDIKESIDAASAMRLMLDNAAIIKRPVLVKGDQLHVGFSPSTYADIFT